MAREFEQNRNRAPEERKSPTLEHQFDGRSTYSSIEAGAFATPRRFRVSQEFLLPPLLPLSTTY